MQTAHCCRQKRDSLTNVNVEAASNRRDPRTRPAISTRPRATGTFSSLPHLTAIDIGTVAIIVFALGALGGLVLASYVLRAKLAPWALSLLHAALGAIGLLLVIYAALSTGISGAALTALIILVIAALGGFYLASIHLRGEVASKAVVFVHAGIAVIGFLTLLGAVVRVI
jgi:hypothetical protein